MKDIFNSYSEYEEESANVYNYLFKCRDTIREYLLKNGELVFPRPLKFSLLDMEGVWVFHSVELDIDNEIIINITSEDTEEPAQIPWDYLNNDLIIIENIISLILKNGNKRN